MVVLARGERLTLRDVPATVRDAVQPGAKTSTGTDLNLQDAEKQLIQNALRRSGGNRTEAARTLGISRRTLHRKLNEYGLRDEPRDSRPSDGKE
jgi:DNA-binding NtrC family response regulator